jgi:hypothetical protein
MTIITTASSLAPVPTLGTVSLSSSNCKGNAIETVHFEYGRCQAISELSACAAGVLSAFRPTSLAAIRRRGFGLYRRGRRLIRRSRASRSKRATPAAVNNFARRTF